MRKLLNGDARKQCIVMRAGTHEAMRAIQVELCARGPCASRRVSLINERGPIGANKASGWYTGTSCLSPHELLVHPCPHELQTCRSMTFMTV
eukprot:2725969-Pleurochrysis_carterae.AAC.3